MSNGLAVDTATAPKVLIVEDEAGLRFVTADVLTHEGGFEVIEASSGDEAAEILAGQDDIRCVFTDVRMPGKLDGLALTRLVRERYPHVPVVIASGNLQSSEIITGVPFMAKPYDAERVSQTIWALINALKPS